MEKIASFQIDHDVLVPGMYVSRVDGDVTTFDLRFVRPNTPPFLPQGALHTIEHLMATFLRNSAEKDAVIYFGPMGCRTGFYFLTRDLPYDVAIRMTKEALAFTAAYEGEIPGATAAECGNWREHDLPEARRWAARQAAVLAEWTPRQLTYPSKND